MFDLVNQDSRIHFSFLKEVRRTSQPSPSSFDFLIPLSQSSICFIQYYNATMHELVNGNFNHSFSFSNLKPLPEGLRASGVFTYAGPFSNLKSSFPGLSAWQVNSFCLSLSIILSDTCLLALLIPSL